MRFKLRVYPDRRTRVIERFLWFPIRVGNKVKWLEKAEIQQTWTSYHYDVFGNQDPNWINEKFL